ARRVPAGRAPLADPARALYLQGAKAAVLAMPDPRPVQVSAQDAVTLATHSRHILPAFPPSAGAMNIYRSVLALSLLAALASPDAHAEIPIDSIAGSDIGFEGLLQADGYWYDNDVLNLDADAGDGLDSDFGLRRAEIAFKGKGPGNF